MYVLLTSYHNLMCFHSNNIHSTEGRVVKIHMNELCIWMHKIYCMHDKCGAPPSLCELPLGKGDLKRQNPWPYLHITML